MQTPFIQIGKRNVGTGYPTFIVAEISANHHKNFEHTKKLIKAIADARADAVKLQTVLLQGLPELKQTATVFVPKQKAPPRYIGAGPQF